VAAVEFEISSVLDAPAATVWSRVSTMDGVNAELAPWVRMTHPAALRSLADAPELVGRLAFHSWLLAGGWIPFDRHALRLVAVEDRGTAGGCFIEESTSWLQARWRHERDVDPCDEGRCRVTDRLLVVPRVALARPVVARVVPWLFGRRHRVLAETFGVGPG
jgi:ligand-binding SRPBCC domain-containing protein